MEIDFNSLVSQVHAFVTDLQSRIFGKRSFVRKNDIQHFQFIFSCKSSPFRIVPPVR